MEKVKVKENFKVEIKYEDSFVAFLDILGFTNFVKNNETVKINTYLEQVDKSIQIIKNSLTSLKYDKKINFIVISDSIILSIQKNNTNNIKEDNNKNIQILRILCTAIQHLQSYLATYDIWLRGAISSGESYFNEDKNQIIGKAYINAYLLEKDFVSNPQIIIDNKIINELRFTNSKDFIDNINIKNSFSLLYDWNGTNHIKKNFPIFINYLDGFINKYSNSSKNKKDEVFEIYSLEKIVKNIENNIYSHANLYTKYKWVANYALSLIDKYQGNEFNKLKERLEKL
ncbi:hypothetical protein [Aliarcobacter cryaerophilus]|uniref:hypothetical protein n=1 Tax=Aliarcobacter cryaerophilus TaxID=28198 RepID=UPI003AF3ABE8